MLGIIPLTIRNYNVYNSSLPLNSNAGYAFYSANHPEHGTNFMVYSEYLVEVWYARMSQIYDPEFLAEDATLIARIGEGNWRYDVYQISNH